MDRLTKDITPENKNYKCRVETPSGVIHCFISFIRVWPFLFVFSCLLIV